MKDFAVLSLGVINITSGNTMYDWSVYDNNISGTGITYLTSDNFLIISAGKIDFPESFNLRHNDTSRLLVRNVSIVDSCPTNLKDTLEMLKRNGYDYYPIKAFKKRISNRKLKTSYTLK